MASLAGQRVALWGWGREGRAAYAALRTAQVAESGAADAHDRFPASLTLFCSPSEADDARALGDTRLRIETEATVERLAAFDVVVKSPGISPYRPEALAAAERGTRFIGGTTLWFATRPDATTICITGTKGKSTTSALLAHLLRAGGHRTALTGNIGQPLLELLEGEAEFWVVELSSYQTRDVARSGERPAVAVVTNIFPEHLDWHGSQARYVEDKLSLLTGARPRIAVLNAGDPTLSALDLSDSAVRWFGRDDGWHLRGDVVWRADEAVFDTRDLPVPGSHNRGNLCAVLAAIEALGLDAEALAPHAATFRALPHRLQVLGTRDGLTYVNDSISTTPHASLAALEVYAGRRVAILVGGHDRGLDWQAFADAMRVAPPAAVVTLGQNGPRIHALLEDGARTGGFALREAHDLGEAVAQARGLLDGEGVVLLSPGAPSFGAYRDYAERGRHFAALAGFDPDAITAIPGIGIA
ncbi:UDP-N-acetylmuramoyl-L-alanine--D-glutamate ligase [Luteimonas sp. M1R5S59]|uniref:UDP-N-acetylmuramoyl-L-alanine--L-glutamate ligase n=1 Tax=Luteimonas kalidii TaxID=3042025 RepID=A0ABT6JYD0_9GAMM|nr:UDP-N-acetylmuramoyl-L-alanine--D-glutamate ligase [Luteimonas kalidii]MDH5835485.1 UDP-N-acetylmuramoyl-L-alanine--D-glutamate ligase [Luteimonas kalidii]